MAVLSFEYDIDFSLIGVHTAEQGYRLAYLLNKYAKTYLTRIDTNENLELFEYEDKYNYVTVCLVKNKYISKNKKAIGFFQEEIETVKYIIPERKKIDYFLKIEDCDSAFLKKIEQQIKNIKEVQTSYIVDVDTLKSKNNLIF